MLLITSHAILKVKDAIFPQMLVVFTEMLIANYSPMLQYKSLESNPPYVDP